jgi:hypothetical protein
LCHWPIAGQVREEHIVTSTPPPTNNDDAAHGNADANGVSGADRAETPVFDNVATEHPEVQDAAPDLVEPAERAAPAERASTEQPVPLVEPAEPEARPIAAAVPVQDAPSELPETAGYDEHVDEPKVVEERPAPAVVPPAQHAQPVQTVFVSAPVAPKKKGNRGFGVFLAFLGTLVFAVLFAAVIALIILLDRPQNAFGGSILGFIGSSAFWVPVVVFFVVFVLFALMVNRGNWVAWVLSSFLMAVIVYLVSIGIVLLFEGLLGMTPAEAGRGFGQLALSAPLIVAGVLAREVTIWFGAAIAARGRKVKERNLEARAAYERELDNQPLGFS